MSPELVLTVPEFLDSCNLFLEASFPSVMVEGEVASFKVNQGKWVFFDLKEAGCSVGCFLPLMRLGVALKDGMRVRVRATPQLTRWGKFSLNIQGILPLGQGNIKKSFELLKEKLTKEGLFDPARKRPLPPDLSKIGVISSVNAAGYADFLRILENRWGGLRIFTINTQVQGLDAPAQIIRALETFNAAGQVEVIAILRGGGSADDLAAFNDELLARAVARSRIPVIAGIGHEVDESLVDLAADVRASTPSNAAERLVPERATARQRVATLRSRLQNQVLTRLAATEQSVKQCMTDAKKTYLARIDTHRRRVQEVQRLLANLNPERLLKQGYAIIQASQPSQSFSPGNVVKITTFKQIITAEVKDAQNRT